MKELLKEIHDSLPTYDAILPFSKQEVSFTPFKVKDSKNISIVLQEDNKKLALKAMVDLLKNCCLKINPLELCLADAEYLFLLIRSKSVEENINLVVNTNHVKINIFNIQTRNDFVNTEIKVSPKLILKVETPKVKNILQLNELSRKNMLLASIKEIVVNKEIYNVEKFVPTEISEFLDNLPLNVLNELEKIKHPELHFSVKVDNEESEVTGFLSFFTFQ
jgi:hypothetical protein